MIQQPPYITAPRYDDRIVQDLQIYFTERLSWLDRSFHIARVGVLPEGKTYPQVQANNGTNENYDIRPDNLIPSYCFFEVEQPYQIDFFDVKATYFLSVTFWGNLNLIDESKSYDYTSELIRDVVKLLERKECGDLKIEENPERVFTKYSALKQDANQYLMKRYTAFKLSFWIKDHLTDECTPNPINDCQVNVNRVLSLPETCQNEIREALGTDCLDATAIVKDQDGNILADEQIPSGQTKEIIVEAGGICLDATVENSDSSYTQTVNSGGTLVLPDSEYIIYVNGDLNQQFTAPSLKDLIINIS
jgi:hypothetical protein